MGGHTSEDVNVAVANLSPRSTRQDVADHTTKKQKRLDVSLIKKVMSEFIGTFILMFTVLSTVVMNDQHGGVEGLLGIAASAGLAVVAVVLSTVHISGSHLNPAVSLAMALFGHLPWLHVVPYAVAQTLACICASLLVNGMYHPANPAVIATVPAVGHAEAFFLEFVLTFVLVFVISAVVFDPHAVKELIAVAIGATITMNALIGGPCTGPSMNPARTLGAAIATGKYTNIWIYLVATPLGAIAGMASYKLIKL